jgi:hypothetical protein
MNIQEIIAKVRAMQIQYMALQKQINSDVTKLEHQLEAKFNERWRYWFGQTSKDYMVCVDAGSHTDQWEPTIYLNSVEAKKLTDQGFWVDESVEDDYDFKLAAVMAPISQEALQTLINEFKLATGADVEIVKVAVKTEKPHVI